MVTPEPDREPRTRRPEWRDVRVVLLAAFLAMLPLLATLPQKHFTADDYWFAGWGEHESDPSACSLAGSFTGDWLTGARGMGGWLRPVPRILFALNDWTFGIERPWGYHLTNILLHGGNTALVVLLALAFLKGARGGRRAALLAGLLFGWFPTAPAAVSWVSGRTDLLATFFILLAMVAATWRCWQAGIAVVAVTTGLASLSKETGFLTPVFVAAVLAAHTVGWEQRWRRDALVGAASLLVAAGVFLWRRHWLGGVGGYGDQFDGLGVRAAFEWIARYVWHGAPLMIFPAALLLAVLVRTPAAAEARRLAAVAAAVWFVAMVPILMLTLTRVENGRYLYLTAVGAALSLPVVAFAGRWGSGFLSLVLGYSLAFFLLTDRAWTIAARECQRVTERLIAAAEDAPGPVVMAYAHMNPATYEEDGLHKVVDRHRLLRGGKILPWDQASWALYRASRNRLQGGWGYREDSIVAGERLLLIDREFRVRAYTPRDVQSLTLPPGAQQFAGPMAAEPPAYALLVAEVVADRRVAPQLESDLHWLTSPETTIPGQPSRHRFFVGLDSGPPAQWRLHGGEGVRLSVQTATWWTISLDLIAEE